MPYRFRIRRSREDAAEGGELIVGTGYRTHHCHWCGQRQMSELWDNCMFCNRPLGQDGWICVACTHRNPDHAKACEACGDPRQE